MDLTPVLTAIRAACPDFRVVGGVAEYDRNAQGVPTAPAVYVARIADEVSEVDRIDAWVRDATTRFGVLIVARHATDPQVGLDALRASVRAALDGRAVFADPEVSPVAWEGGQLHDLAPGLLWWQDTYRFVWPVSADRSPFDPKETP